MSGCSCPAHRTRFVRLLNWHFNSFH